jgi:hypothetical protein
MFGAYPQNAPMMRPDMPLVTNQTPGSQPLGRVDLAGGSIPARRLLVSPALDG